MLSIPGQPGKDVCDKSVGVTRRDIVRVGGSGMLGLSLGGMLQLQAQAAKAGPVLPLYIVEPALWQEPDMSARHWAFITECLAARRSTVVDADALTLFEDAPHLLFEQLHANCVLTPHGGEFRRLFPDLADQAAYAARSGKCTAVAKAAARAGCTILLKGVETVIATEKGDVALHAATAHRAAPWLATAGAGDVLAGFITGLMARGFGPFSAATAAAWVHVECARRFGPGLIAEDLPEQAPAVLAGLCD